MILELFLHRAEDDFFVFAVGAALFLLGYRAFLGLLDLTGLFPGFPVAVLGPRDSRCYTSWMIPGLCCLDLVLDVRP